MNINDFKYVLKIAELKSYSAAARECYITQPSISQRVKFIESEYGITIFKRDHNGVEITSEGERFLKYASRIMECEKNLRKEFADESSREPKVIRVGMSWTVTSGFFQDLIPKICSDYPDIRFEFMEFTSKEQQAALLSDKLDIGFCYLPISSKDLSYRILMEDEIVLVPAAGSLLNEKTAVYSDPGCYISPDYLNNEPFATALKGSRLHNYLDALIEAEGVCPDIRHIIRSLPYTYSLAETGLASAFLFKSFFINRKSSLPYYYIDSPISNKLPFSITWRKDSLMSEFAEELSHKLRHYIVFTS